MNPPFGLTSPVNRRLSVILLTLRLARHWLMIFIVVLGLLNLLAFLAPVAMRLGWVSIGNAIYTLYSPLCHQMAQRSFFLFGSQAMYNLDELPLNFAGNKINDLLLLKAFQGSPDLGWKVAWSDRMVAMYGGIWLGGIVYGVFRQKHRLKPISTWMLLLLLIPIAIDGITHMVSDINGLTTGFRYTNEWLATVTSRNLPDSFYRGDALGSFNSWMRLISGVLFSIGIAAFSLPLVDQESRFIVRTFSDKLARYDEEFNDSWNDDRPNGA